MKRVVSAAMMSLLFTAFAAAGEWKEMEAFHMVMAETFHPTEEGNLQPLRDNAGDLAAKARTWRDSKVPAGYDGEKTAKALNGLVARCEKLEAAVKAKQSDAELTKLITEAHDAFHAIIGECKSET
jgi:hypothetical protein